MTCTCCGCVDLYWLTMPTNLSTLRAQPLTLIGPATQALADGGSIGAWRTAMQQAIKRSQTAAYIAAIKDKTGVMPKGLSRAERKELDARINEQLKYLPGFVQDLKDGKLSMAQAQARANLYSGATRGTYYATRYPGLSAVPGDGSTPCLGNCRCTLDERADGVWWVLHPAEHCGGCLDMASGSPYKAEAA